MSNARYIGATLAMIAAFGCGIASTQRTPVVPADPSLMMQQGIVQVEYRANKWAIAPALAFLALSFYLGLFAGLNKPAQQTSSVQEPPRPRPEPVRSPEPPRAPVRTAAPAPAPVKLPPLPGLDPLPLNDEQEDVWEEPAPEPAPEPKPDPRYMWMPSVVDAAKLWMIGPEGSGKTSKCEWLAEEYVKRGYEVWIVDPHAAAGQWHPLRVFGRGQSWEDLNTGISKFCKETTRRIADRGNVKFYDPLEDEKRIILICEEMSAWAEKADQDVLREFFTILPGDLRKANVGVVFVSHGQTLDFIGGEAAKGKKQNLIDSFMRMFCFSEQIPGTQSYRPLPYAEIYKPKDKSPTRVDVPSTMIGTGEHFYTCSRLKREKQEMKARRQQSKVVELKPQIS